MSLTARVASPRYLLGHAPHAVAAALHAEWTKFRTVAGPSWLLAGITRRWWRFRGRTAARCRVLAGGAACLP